MAASLAASLISHVPVPPDQVAKPQQAFSDEAARLAEIADRCWCGILCARTAGWPWLTRQRGARQS